MARRGKAIGREMFAKMVSRSYRREIRKRIGVAATALAAIVLAGAAYFYQPRGRVDVTGEQPASKAVSRPQTPFEDPSILPEKYVAKVIKSSYDPEKRSIYFIFQRHAIDRSYADAEERHRSVIEALPCQVSIFRIAESMYKRGIVKSIALEGHGSTDYGDIENPGKMRHDWGGGL